MCFWDIGRTIFCYFLPICNRSLTATTKTFITLVASVVIGVFSSICSCILCSSSLTQTRGHCAAYGAGQIRAKNVQFAAQHCSLLQLHVTDIEIVFDLKSTKPKIRQNIK